jgi:hypothetical protein
MAFGIYSVQLRIAIVIKLTDLESKESSEGGEFLVPASFSLENSKLPLSEEIMESFDQ